MAGVLTGEFALLVAAVLLYVLSGEEEPAIVMISGSGLGFTAYADGVVDAGITLGLIGALWWWVLHPGAFAWLGLVPRIAFARRRQLATAALALNIVVLAISSAGILLYAPYPWRGEASIVLLLPSALGLLLLRGPYSREPRTPPRTAP